MDYKDFENPTSHFRPAPFWAINDLITPEETARQMREMIRVGLSGGFFHSRAGLTTDYLGEDWFSAMDAALQVAKEEDGYLWLYDEDLWPSGNAGGQVAHMDDEYRTAVLAPVLLVPGEAVPADEADSVFRAAYLISRDGLELKQAQILTQEQADELSDMERLAFFRVYEGKTGWWSGESYANLLNPKVTEEFMRLTHEVYKDKLGHEFGKRIPGIFTDEPQLHFGGGRHKGGIPWYEGLPAVYKSWYSRDFWADLPYLYFNGKQCRKIRLLIHRALLRQFCEAYSKPIYEWCESNNIAHTGHYNAEDTFMSQIQNHGGSVMAHYRYQQIPGVDVLCRNTDGHLLTLKQVSSAARQLGRKRVLTEIFGVTRHTAAFQDFKWLGDYNQVLGANLFCPHLTLYSAKGKRKRDYPPNWNYQQTYWNDLKPLNDYFARLSAALSSGKAKVDCLLLHPIESGTAGHRLSPRSSRALPGEDFGSAQRYDRSFRSSLEAILNAGYECDLGDEWFIEDLGAVDGDEFRIGEMGYKIVIVPPSDTWRPKTFELLRTFAGNGGRLIFLGSLPAELDCDDAREQWRNLSGKAMIVPCSRGQLQTALDKVAPKDFSLRTPEGKVAPKTFVHHRVDGSREFFFIVNSDRELSQSYELTLHEPDGQKYGKILWIWDPLSGERKRATTQKAGDGLRCDFYLPPAGSVLFTAEESQSTEAPQASPHILNGTPALPSDSGGEAMALPGVWDYECSEENVLVLDRIEVSVDGGATWWGEDLEFRVRRRLAQHFGTAGALQWQPWVAIRKGLFDGKGGDVTLRYRFSSDIAEEDLRGSGGLSIVIEDLHKGELYVNGCPVGVNPVLWHWDKAFGKADISRFVVQGENIVDFKVPYDFLTEVESAYIVGDFGVRLVSPYRGVLVPKPKKIENGSWLEQGFPFYSGCITYKAGFDLPQSRGVGDHRIFLRLKKASGVLYKVRINGSDAGKILWQPHLMEITEWVNRGSNNLEIEVVSSRQNTLGPLHEIYGDDNHWVGPGAFDDENNIREEFSLFDYGLLGGAEILNIHP